MDKAVDIGSFHQLLVDDFLIAEATDVAWQVQPARKHPANPLLVPERPWEVPAAYLYGTVVRADDGFQMWYQTQGRWDDGRHETFICYAESPDGINWHKPAVGLPLYDDQPSNALHVGEIGTVVFAPWDAAPSHRYVMTYFHPDDPRGYRVLVSPDGVDWSAFRRDPIFPRYGDVGNLVWDPYGEQFLFFVKPRRVVAVRGPRRAVALSRSADLENWSLPELILAPDRQDDATADARIAPARPLLEFDDPGYYRCHFYGMGALPYEGLYLGFLWVFDATAAHPGGNEDGPMEVQLVCSRDLKVWKRCGGREPIIPRGEIGQWDCGMIQTVSSPIVVGDEIWLYYGGWRVTHGCRWFWDRSAPQPPVAAAIGLATIPRDRFVAVTPQAGAASATLVTGPLIWTSGALWVNADCSAGALRAEVLDPSGAPIEGYSAPESDPVRTDTPASRLTWAGRDAAPLASRPLQIRFHLSGAAKLYSFWAE